MKYTDEQIIAAILAGGHTSGRGIYPQMRSGLCDSDGPVCAISAGILYRAIDHSDLGAPVAFADAYGVPLSCAYGVSDGFEQVTGSWDGQKRWGVDYQRGWAIGAAVRSDIESETP